MFLHFGRIFNAFLYSWEIPIHSFILKQFSIHSFISEQFPIYSFILKYFFQNKGVFVRSLMRLS
jgi:hypothetical protein